MPRFWVRDPECPFGHIAQSVERKAFNLVAVGSSPTVSFFSPRMFNIPGLQSLCIAKYLYEVVEVYY
jgi:hypothetical protein